MASFYFPLSKTPSKSEVLTKSSQSEDDFKLPAFAPDVLNSERGQQNQDSDIDEKGIVDSQCMKEMSTKNDAKSKEPL